MLATKNLNADTNSPPPKQKTELEKAFAVLGVAPTATKEQAKRAYRMLAKEFHSDAQSGASESIKKIADEKMAEINVAWGMIKKARKWK